MKIEYLIQLMNNRMIKLREEKILAENDGRLDLVLILDEEILETSITIDKLNMAK